MDNCNNELYEVQVCDNGIVLSTYDDNHNIETKTAILDKDVVFELGKILHELMKQFENRELSSEYNMIISFDAK